MTEQQEIVFKKYRDNRRMWNETESHYATIPEVLGKVLAGHKVTVYMAEGRAKRHKGAPTVDVTHFVLMDALHLRQHEHPTLSAEDLAGLIRGELIPAPIQR